MTADTVRIKSLLRDDRSGDADYIAQVDAEAGRTRSKIGIAASRQEDETT
jgi:hypothetical protein